MRIRWPFMMKWRHEEIVGMLNDHLESTNRSWMAVVDREYARATRDGRAKVHAWAREAASNVFNGSSAQAAFQQAEAVFSPEKLTFGQFIALPHETQEVIAGV